MPGMASDAGDQTMIPLSSEVVRDEPEVHPLRLGLRPPISGISISWSRGNLLRVAFFRDHDAPDGGEEDVGGKVVEVRLGGRAIDGCGGVDEARRRRVSYGSVPAFALLQGQKNSFAAVTRMSPYPSLRAEWWENVLDYSKHISSLLGDPKPLLSSVIDDPKTILNKVEEPTYLKAAWELLEIFYVDKQSLAWLPEQLVDWLADYDRLLARESATVHSNLVMLQKKLVSLQVVEDDPEYWEGVSQALAIGWLEIVVKLLRLHGSYQLDQLGDRETENGLVETVAVLVSTMPRMRPDLPPGKLGQCYKTKPDFVKAWEKWREQINKLDCSAFWFQCGHRQTREGLKNLLQIMLGKVNYLNSATGHWMELCISHFLYVRPFTMGLDGTYNLAQKCMQTKPMSQAHTLTGLLIGILGENTEVVLAKCSKAFGPWMVVHAMELLTAENTQAEALLHEERYNLGGISIEELNRLVYAQMLSSEALTWQIAPVYLASCPKQGFGLLDILLYMQPVQHQRVLLKSLEICRLYELESTSSTIMKIAGMYHWKHGRKGSGIFWLQQARDEIRLNRIAQQLFDYIGKSISDDSFKQWEGMIELLGSEVGTAGGLEFLHKYRDYKKFLQHVRDGIAVDVARQAVESLIQLMRSPSTPQRFWLPLLRDSLKLLDWRDRPLLNVPETNLLLSKLQELSMAKLRPDFCQIETSSQDLSSIRLALARNLGRAILEEGNLNLPNIDPHGIHVRAT
ncbi:Nuclear pore complex protein Nup85 [Acorus gramineus]|uniref:Nuclear pore complex protein Nup85 n=1 Tax=Acorus gramineus TaxID=55184 RepID=A0AAV9AT32_ACOGR|nr:Nuclear pore complex protein Nup85 [Acorus gramineus]